MNARHTDELTLSGVTLVDLPGAFTGGAENNAKSYLGCRVLTLRMKIAQADGDRAVAKPVAVRYAWANSPRCNLYNREALPAAPFPQRRMADAGEEVRASGESADAVGHRSR